MEIWFLACQFSVLVMSCSSNTSYKSPPSQTTGQAATVSTEPVVHSRDQRSYWFFWNKKNILKKKKVSWKILLLLLHRHSFGSRLRLLLQHGSEFRWFVFNTLYRSLDPRMLIYFQENVKNAECGQFTSHKPHIFVACFTIESLESFKQWRRRRQRKRYFKIRLLAFVTFSWLLQFNMKNALELSKV